jgi:hypothetical protein
MQFVAGQLFSISVGASVDDPVDIFGTGEHPTKPSH